MHIELFCYCCIVWDLRNAKKPVNVAYNLDIVNPEANVIFSPDERLILTGTACPKGKGFGQLVMLNRDTLQVQESISKSFFYKNRLKTKLIDNILMKMLPNPALLKYYGTLKSIKSLLVVQTVLLPCSIVLLIHQEGPSYQLFEKQRSEQSMITKSTDLLLHLMLYPCLKMKKLELQREREINYVKILLHLVVQVKKNDLFD